MHDAALAELEATLKREMPICTPMGMRPVRWDGQQLTVEMPLEPNRNHQYSAFAGSLNALCTVVGWGTVFLLLKSQGLAGNIVIRRSQVRYTRPVRDAMIVAEGLVIDGEQLRYFFELLREKGRSKLDVHAQIADADGAFVKFCGSYVVQD